MTTDSTAPAVEQTSDAPFEGETVPGSEADSAVDAAVENSEATKAEEVGTSDEPIAIPEPRPMTSVNIESVENRIKELDKIRDARLKQAADLAAKKKDELEARLKEERAKAREGIEAELKKSKNMIRSSHKEATKQWKRALAGLKAEAAMPRDLAEPPADKSDEKSDEPKA